LPSAPGEGCGRQERTGSLGAGAAGDAAAGAPQFSCFPPVTPGCASLPCYHLREGPCSKVEGNGVRVCVSQALQPAWPPALGMSQNGNFHKAAQAIGKENLHFFMKVDRKFLKLFQERK